MTKRGAAFVTLAVALLLAACSDGAFDAGAVDEFPRGSVTTFADGELVASAILGEPGDDVLLDGDIVFHLVRLEDGAFLALYARDSHSQCWAPWRPDFRWPGGDESRGTLGWFRDPCSGSTYDVTGFEVFGPAPRDLDRFPVTIEDDRVLVTLDLDTLILGETRVDYGSPDGPAPTPQPTEPAAAGDSERATARATLAQIPGVAEAVRAVESGDVEALLRLFVRSEALCPAPSFVDANLCFGNGCARALHNTCSLAGRGEEEPIETILMRTIGFPGRLSMAIGGRWLESELRPVLEAMIGGGAQLELADFERIYFADVDGRLFFEDWYRLGFSTRPVDGQPLGAFRAGEQIVLDALGLIVVAGEDPPTARFALLGPEARPESRPYLPQPLPSFALDLPSAERLLPDAPEAATVRSEIGSIPALDAIISAAESGDVEALLALVQTLPVTCFPTSVRHDFDRCVERTAAVDGSYPGIAYQGFWEGQPRSLNEVGFMLQTTMARGNPRLSFVASMIGPAGGTRYLLAFASLPVSSREVSQFVLLGDAVLLGFGLEVEVAAERPIVSFAPLTENTSAADWAKQFEETQSLLLPAGR